MAIQRWNPSRALREWDPFREMEEMMEGFFRPSSRRMLPAGMGWMPVIDMYEKDDRFVIKAELPGMTKEGIDISITDHSLTIKGERKAERESREENYYFSERSYGRFFRTVSLPPNTDASKIEATYNNGVLEIDVPKVPETRAKKVEIAEKMQGEQSSS